MEHALTKFRLAAGLSRKEVALKAGTSRQTIHRIEAGDQQPSWELAAKLIEVSGGRLSANDFMPTHAVSEHVEAAE